MFFKLSNIMTNFEDYIIKIFIKKFNIFVIIFLDNILIYIKDLKQINIKIIY